MRRRVVVRGRVQGVGFRYFVQRHAVEAGLDGSVRNLGDGTVECVLEGGPEAVAAVLERIRSGPPSARVDSVEISDEAAGQAGSGFRIG